MVFSSLTFLCVFLPVVMLLYPLCHSISVKNGLLIIASLLFYAYGEPVYILLMLVSILLNYGFALWIDRSPDRKLPLVLSVTGNLGLLFLFKYLDFTIHLLNVFFHLNIPLPGLALPIGISFFTFQALSYVIDVYRKEVPCQKKLSSLVLYISFFPQLIAGPIVKYHDIEKEITDRHSDLNSYAQGMKRFTVGLAKKVLIANQMAYIADILFAVQPGNLNICSAWLAALAYLFQIYFDFSGYSDMAIGLGRMFGFHFRENFNYPYISVSIQEFWRRWHISLSTWFKEYLYIPLGGNRKGKLRTYLNKLIVFFCTGLWHGANLTFIVWGLWHGFFIILEDKVKMNRLPEVIRYLITMLIVILGFVMFRADSLSQGLMIIARMFDGWNFDQRSMTLFTSCLSGITIAALIAACILSVPWSWYIPGKVVRLQSIQYTGSVLLLILCLLQLSSGTYNPFIYFRF